MRKVTGECSVWNTSPDWQKVEKMKPTDFMVMAPDADMTKSGWVKVGTGKVEFDLVDANQEVANHIASLTAQRDAVMAQYWTFDEKIKNLQAISYEPTAESGGTDDDDTPF